MSNKGNLMIQMQIKSKSFGLISKWLHHYFGFHSMHWNLIKVVDWFVFWGFFFSSLKFHYEILPLECSTCFLNTSLGCAIVQVSSFPQLTRVNVSVWWDRTRWGGFPLYFMSLGHQSAHPSLWFKLWQGCVFTDMDRLLCWTNCHRYSLLSPVLKEIPNLWLSAWQSLSPSPWHLPHCFFKLSHSCCAQDSWFQSGWKNAQLYIPLGGSVFYWM